MTNGLVSPAKFKVISEDWNALNASFKYLELNAIEIKLPSTSAVGITSSRASPISLLVDVISTT